MNTSDRDTDVPAVAVGAETVEGQPGSRVEYSSPSILPLGKTRDLILGYWSEGYQDYSSGYKHAGD